MTALRFVLIVVMTLAATQIAAADTKKSKSSTGSIEVNSYSWGLLMLGHMRERIRARQTPHRQWGRPAASIRTAEASTLHQRPTDATY